MYNLDLFNRRQENHILVQPLDIGLRIWWKNTIFIEHNLMLRKITLNSGGFQSELLRTFMNHGLRLLDFKVLVAKADRSWYIYDTASLIQREYFDGIQVHDYARL